MKPQLPDWVVDYFSFENGRVRANGWILPSVSGAKRSILVNGKPSECRIIGPRNDVSKAWSSAARYANPIGFDLSADEEGTPDEIELVLCEEDHPHSDIGWYFK